MTEHLSGRVVAPDDAHAYWNRGALWTVCLSADQTHGAFTLLEQLMPEGNAPPPHVHERATEGFYVIEGEIDFTVDGKTVHAGPGTSAWIPPNTEHSFVITSPEARILNFYLPGGFDDRLDYFATPAGARTLPPPDFRDANDQARAAAYRDRIRDLHEETPIGDWTEPGS